MSSNEEEHNEGDSLSARGLKKRRIQRACDICRRKKIRCDGVQMPGNRCSNCVSYSLDCTYVEASKKRGPPKGYVESLENRVEKLDKLLHKLLPDDTLLKELQDAIDKEQTPLDPSPLVSSHHPTFRASPEGSIDTLTSAIRGTSTSVTPPNDLAEDEADISILTENLKELTFAPTQYRYFGKSSGTRLIKAAMDLKQQYTQSLEPISKATFSRTEFWGDFLSEPFNTQSPRYTFPEEDLASDLIDIYFCHVNLYLPLLQRPIFEKSVAEGLHHTDEHFAVTYLLVCALGSRYSDDPRVLLDGVDSPHSAGLKWFNQVQMVKKSFMSPPTLYDLQFYCLTVQFLQGSTAPQSCWIMVGVGIRLAQDIGAKRRKNHGQTVTAEDEQWKRGFWVLVCLDRLMSSALGRPCAIHDDDFDVDLPIDCDDEYWDHRDPEQRFKQPDNKPSMISYFNMFIKLNQILAYCLRTIYAINKSKMLLGYAGEQWEQRIVAELDSALNKWVDSVPDHLRWDPTREDDRFFNQSASLYTLYYHIQILIHRPFIPSPNQPSSLSFPSLAICTNAARSCSHIVDCQRRRNPLLPIHSSLAIFTVGIVLLLNIWGGKRSGLSVDPYKEMADVHKCMKTLRVLEKRWRSVGRLSDVLTDLASAGDLPLPQGSPMAVNKRERDSDTPMSSTSSGSPQPVPQDDSPRVIAGSRRVKKDHSGPGQSKNTASQSQHQPEQQKWHPPPPPPQLPSTSTSQLPNHNQPNHNHRHPDPSVTSSPPYTLPVYTDELGRIPLHGHHNLAYYDQANYWHQSVPHNGGSSNGNGIIESNQSNPNPDDIVLSNASNSSSVPQHSNRRQHQHQQQQQARDHNHLSSSHNNSNANNYAHSATETNTITQRFPLHSTIGTENMMFDPISLMYIPQGSYVGVPPSIDLVPSQNPVGVGGRTSHSNFRGVRSDLGIADQRQGSSRPPSHLEQPHRQHHHHHTQGQHEHDVHNNHHHREQQQPQQQQTMGYFDNDTMAMWSNAPTGFELDEWGTYLSNMSELAQGGHSGGGQMHVQQPR